MLRPVLLALAVALAAGPALADSHGFRSPSGNIGCDYDNDNGPRLICTRLKPDVQSAILTEGMVDVGPPEMEDDSWLRKLPVLPYGKSRKLGPFTCVSKKTGVTCSGRKHGFSMSRSEINSY